MGRSLVALRASIDSFIGAAGRRGPRSGRPSRGLWSGGAGVVPFRPLELRLAGGPMTQSTSEKARFAKGAQPPAPGLTAKRVADSKTGRGKTARSGPFQIQHGTLCQTWTARLGLRNLGHRLPYRLPQKGLQGILLPRAAPSLSCLHIKHRPLHIILTPPPLDIRKERLLASW
jgi:hypothetical protein